MKLILVVMTLLAFYVLSTNTICLKGSKRCYSCQYSGTGKVCLDHQTSEMKAQKTM